MSADEGGAGGNDLASALAARTAPAELFAPGSSPGELRCTACAHRCVLHEGRVGACGVRFMAEGALRAPYGYVARAYVRQVETNTIYHVRPGSNALTFGMFGCDLRCPYCHNWKVSQALREGVEGDGPTDVTPEALVERALREGCAVICAAYNEPMIAAEWAKAIFTAAKAAGLMTALITDGHTTTEALAFMRPVTDVVRVDLKAARPESYRALGGRLAPVLESIREARAMGYWVEVVTLVVPGFNSTASELREIAAFVASVDPAIPLHYNAFYPRYKLTAALRTPGLALVSAAGTAYALGLRHVYVGNLADEVSELSHTRCPSCSTTVVERRNYRTSSVRLVAGACPSCRTPVGGLWG